MPRGESNAKKFINANRIEQVPGGGRQGPAGSAGATGAAGQGVPTGGTDGQVLTKVSATNYDTDWETPTGGFPVTYDDGTYVYTISASGGSLTVDVANGGGSIGSFSIAPSGGTGWVSQQNESIQINAQGTAVLSLYGGTSSIFLSTGGGIGVTGLPTSDPGNPGQLYHLLGVVHVSL